MGRVAIMLALALLAPAGVATAQQGRGDCDADKRLFIRDQMAGAGMGACIGPVSGISRGATLTFQRDHESDRSSGHVQGALGWKLTGPATAGRLGYATYLYAEADGFFDADDGTSQLRLGFHMDAFIQHMLALGDARPENRADLFMSYGLGAFYLTDFDGEARGYGIKATVTPFLTRDRFGVNFQGADAAPYFIAEANLEGLWVDKGGNTGLADDEDYLSLDAKLGFGYAVKGQFDLSISHTRGVDLVNGLDYKVTDARLTLPIGQSETTKLALVYARNDDERTGEKTETTSLKFEVKF